MTVEELLIACEAARPGWGWVQGGKHVFLPSGYAAVAPLRRGGGFEASAVACKAAGGSPAEALDALDVEIDRLDKRLRRFRALPRHNNKPSEAEQAALAKELR